MSTTTGSAAPSDTLVFEAVAQLDRDRAVYLEARDQFLAGATNLLALMCEWAAPHAEGAVPKPPTDVRNAVVRVFNARNEAIAGMNADCPRAAERVTA